MEDIKDAPAPSFAGVAESIKLNADEVLRLGNKTIDALYEDALHGLKLAEDLRSNQPESYSSSLAATERNTLEWVKAVEEGTISLQAAIQTYSLTNRPEFTEQMTMAKLKGNPPREPFKPKASQEALEPKGSKAMNYYYYEANSYAEFTVQTKDGERGNNWHIRAGTAIAVDDNGNLQGINGKPAHFVRGAEGRLTPMTDKDANEALYFYKDTHFDGDKEMLSYPSPDYMRQKGYFTPLEGHMDEDWYGVEITKEQYEAIGRGESIDISGQEVMETQDGFAHKGLEAFKQEWQAMYSSDNIKPDMSRDEEIKALILQKFARSCFERATEEEIRMSLTPLVKNLMESGVEEQSAKTAEELLLTKRILEAVKNEWEADYADKEAAGVPNPRADAEHKIVKMEIEKELAEVMQELRQLGQDDKLFDKGETGYLFQHPQARQELASLGEKLGGNVAIQMFLQATENVNATDFSPEVMKGFEDNYWMLFDLATKEQMAQVRASAELEGDAAKASKVDEMERMYDTMAEFRRAVLSEPPQIVKHFGQTQEITAEDKTNSTKEGISMANSEWGKNVTEDLTTKAEAQDDKSVVAAQPVADGQGKDLTEDLATKATVQDDKINIDAPQTKVTAKTWGKGVVPAQPAQDGTEGKDVSDKKEPAMAQIDKKTSEAMKDNKEMRDIAFKLMTEAKKIGADIKEQGLTTTGRHKDKEGNTFESVNKFWVSVEPVHIPADEKAGKPAQDYLQGSIRHTIGNDTISLNTKRDSAEIASVTAVRFVRNPEAKTNPDAKKMIREAYAKGRDIMDEPKFNKYAKQVVARLYETGVVKDAPTMSKGMNIDKDSQLGKFAAYAKDCFKDGAKVMTDNGDTKPDCWVAAKHDEQYGDNITLRSNSEPNIVIELSYKQDEQYGEQPVAKATNFGMEKGEHGYPSFYINKGDDLDKPELATVPEEIKQAVADFKGFDQREQVKESENKENPDKPAPKKGGKGGGGRDDV